MKIGICMPSDDPEIFFKEIVGYLSLQHQLEYFKHNSLETPFLKERIYRYLSRRNLDHFLSENDVVFFEWASQLLVEATRLPKKCGIVTRLHRYEMYHWANQINWQIVDRIILVSRAKEKEFLSRFPSEVNKTRVIPEAISLQKFKPSQKQYSGDIGILCDLIPRKRIYDLLLAFYELNKISNNFRLHIAGGPNPAHMDYFHSIEDIVQRLKLENKVTFYGGITNPWDWYSNIDIFISNSYSEGLQVAPMEAMASGCYVLSHYWDGADELLPFDQLYFSSQELISKILDYSSLSDSVKSNKKALMQSIVKDNFDVEQIQVKINDVITEVGTLL